MVGRIFHSNPKRSNTGKRAGEKMGISIVDLHVSGHADKQAIDMLIARTNPKEIKFVHTDKEVL